MMGMTNCFEFLRCTWREGGRRGERLRREISMEEGKPERRGERGEEEEWVCNEGNGYMRCVILLCYTWMERKKEQETRVRSAWSRER